MQWPLSDQELLIDADDTLWENNIYFEEAFAEFVRFLSHSRLSAEQIRRILDDIELENIERYGYGSQNFGRNMRECYLRLAERPVRPEDLDYITRLAEQIMEKPLELIEGVPETLAYLASRHRLTLFTKGQPDEQWRKIKRSGLESFFSHVVIVKEKDAPAYRRLVEQLNLDPRRTWMIGNSPKSDIRPALEAGLRAVYVPHPRTWHLERDPLPPSPDGRLLVVERFSELQRYF